MNNDNLINFKWKANIDDKAYYFTLPSDKIRSTNNEIYFTSDVDTVSIEFLIKEFNKVIKEYKTSISGAQTTSTNMQQVITLFIDSPGGTGLENG